MAINLVAAALCFFGSAENFISGWGASGSFLLVLGVYNAIGFALTRGR